MSAKTDENDWPNWQWSGSQIFSKPDDKITSAEADAAFHPRAAKIMRKHKNFVVVTEDEPYFIKVYAMIRYHEKKIGRWSVEDEMRYAEAFDKTRGGTI